MATSFVGSDRRWSKERATLAFDWTACSRGIAIAKHRTGTEEKMTTETNAQGGKPIVLVGIDFSPSSRETLRTAADIARSGQGELHLVYVAANPVSLSTAILSADRPLERASEADAEHARLERLASEVAREIPRVVLHTRVGSADVEIAQLALEIGADLLVVGAGGAKRLERALLGSVADSLVRNAPCPVLAYRARSGHPWDRIEPPCADCVAVQRSTGRARLWCDRHAQHHPRAHTYRETPASYGVGSQTFRDGSS
jgi:nucleotide-binding universal stress UspA family protein